MSCNHMCECPDGMKCGGVCYRSREADGTPVIVDVVVGRKGGVDGKPVVVKTRPFKLRDALDMVAKRHGADGSVGGHCIADTDGGVTGRNYYFPDEAARIAFDAEVVWDDDVDPPTGLHPSVAVAKNISQTDLDDVLEEATLKAGHERSMFRVENGRVIHKDHKE